jgi:dephospho-CoA kinase
MIKRVGVVGGIGSGKSFVCKTFSNLFGVLTFNSDKCAKILMNKDSKLSQIIKNEFGEDSYINGYLNRDKFIELLFCDEKSRMKMNSIVHPFVRDEFDKWCEIWKNDDYTLFESAILFDTKERLKTDFNILVVADMDVRIKRVQERDSCSVEDVKNRINSQSSDDFKKPLADFIITNNSKEDTYKQIIEIHQKITSSL